MLRKNWLVKLVVAFLLFGLFFTGCGKKTVQGPPMPPGLGGPGMPGAGSPSGDSSFGSAPLTDEKLRALGITTEEQKREFLRQKEQFENEDIHFDFDSSVIREDAKPILAKKAEFLKKYPTLTITIEGHCDERGTNEYNLALGERRAHSAWQYLVNLGINPERMQMISYGEERPIATGHDEASWAKNRRAHFVIHF
ncbi:MAG: peptidoglycan-associated lipoprotein Pal [Syntrophobacterales bacterium]|nr:peptidoglycan-associated lipoprotein Pal [Syntrophobacterales bacterium]